jgi:uncharacterized membrane protein (DUF4010 family)
MFFQILTAWLLWAFVGLEREIPRESFTEKSGRDHFGWLRSFALIAMIGALTTWFDAHFWWQTFTILGFVAITLFILAVHTYTAFKNGDLGVTTELSAIFVYFIGVLTMLGNIKFALVLTVVLTLIMSAKEYMESIKSSISRQEIINTLKFAVIAFVILPLLPDEKYSFASLLTSFWLEGASAWSNAVWQMKFFNPYSVWFFVVTMSSIGYVGYILSRMIGKGSSVILSSAIGGLVSSTAVTATMSEQSKWDPTNSYLYVVGTLLANCIMFLRVIFIVFFFNIALMWVFIVPALMMFFTLALATLYFYWKARNEKPKKSLSIDEKVKSPFSITPAVKFGWFVLFIKFLAGIGLIYKDIWWEKIFYYALGIMSGLADVDAITQTMATQSKEGLILGSIATSTILLWVMSNNTVKASIAYKFWEKNFGRNVMLSFVFSIIAGIIGIIAINFIG